ncbi:hypothetical protein [Nocardioides lentus]|uniref:hypothetical protein n=1 Tax=Nocardioides lentus TaxID=338077 RepID=UPI0031D0D50C
MAVTRLRVPGWSVLVVLAIVVVGTVGLLLMAREAGGWTGSGVGLAAVGLAILGLAFAWAARPAHGVMPPETEPLRGSVTLAVLVGVGTVLGLVGAGVTSWFLLSEPASGLGRRGQGAGLVLAVAVLASVPTLVRAGTGRLHLWCVSTDSDGLRYRGGRTDRTIAWDAIGSVALNEVGTQVVVRPRADGEPPLRFSALCFDVPAGRVVERIEAARGRRRPRGPGPVPWR